MSRVEVFRSLVGSHNYNLNDESSDRDYKVFVLPSFDDLYSKKQFSNSIVGDEVDLEFHDIRKVIRLWEKSNVNFVEVLFSEETVINTELNDRSREIVEQILDMKESIARMNLSYLYSACVGMHYNKKKLLDKGTSGTQYLVDQFGYDTKQFQHAFRVLDVLDKYQRNGFKDFKSAIWYEDGSKKDFMVKMKKGHYTRKEAGEILFKKLNSTYAIEDIYKTRHVNEDTKSKLYSLVKELVRINL